jgi:hypothetical protein
MSKTPLFVVADRCRYSECQMFEIMEIFSIPLNFLKKKLLTHFYCFKRNIFLIIFIFPFARFHGMTSSTTKNPFPTKINGKGSYSRFQ